jgi:hypothetical protein
MQALWFDVSSSDTTAMNPLPYPGLRLRHSITPTAIFGVLSAFQWTSFSVAFSQQYETLAMDILVQAPNYTTPMTVVQSSLFSTRFPAETARVVNSISQTISSIVVVIGGPSDLNAFASGTLSCPPVDVHLLTVTALLVI